MKELTIQLDGFEGPLDLLYHLIQKHEIDIYDIPIAKLADQYIAYLESMPNKDMDSMSEFLVMAATLIAIKTKTLLPKLKDEEEEGSDPREELVNKLLEYKKIKDVADEWKILEENSAFNMYKEADSAIQKMKEEEPERMEDFLQGLTIEELYHAFQQVMVRKEDKIDHVRSSFKSVTRDTFTVQEKMAYIRDLLIIRPKTNFFEIFHANVRKMEKVVTFLALLEMMKGREIRIFQRDTFGEIEITRYSERD